MILPHLLFFSLVMPHLVILTTHQYLDFVHVPEDKRFTVYEDEREGDYKVLLEHVICKGNQIQHEFI